VACLFLVRYTLEMSARAWVQILFHQKPAFEVPMTDIVLANNPRSRVVMAGCFAGLFVGFIPGLFYLLNISLMFASLLFSWDLSGMRSGLYDVASVIGRMVPTILGSGVVGGLLALLRRRTVQRKAYKDVLAMRLGQNTVVATVAGIVLGLPFVVVIGPIAVFLGFIFDTVWEVVHNFVLDRWTGPDKSHVVSQEIRSQVGSDPSHPDMLLDDVVVENGRVVLIGSWPDEKAKRNIEDNVRGIEGVSTVLFRSSGTP